ncbi:CL12A protein, partial [Pomatostomus ruficeps]|nr:CL12A protein [Pomatostomus ruficeps]
CPKGWIGHSGVCSFLSRDKRSWEQDKACCFSLGASLTVLEDREMEFLFPFSRERDYWLGLRR